MFPDRHVPLLQGKARERLTAALRRCPRSAAGNRSKLLKYLVPVQARCPAGHPEAHECAYGWPVQLHMALVP
jgi:hypothetical protein